MAKMTVSDPDGSASADNGLLSRRQWLQLGAGGAAATMVAPVWATGDLNPGAVDLARHRQIMAINHPWLRSSASRFRSIPLALRPGHLRHPAAA